MESPISFFNEDVKYILKDKNAIREWITSGVKKEKEGKGRDNEKGKVTVEKRKR